MCASMIGLQWHRDSDPVADMLDGGLMSRRRATVMVAVAVLIALACGLGLRQLLIGSASRGFVEGTDAGIVSAVQVRW